MRTYTYIYTYTPHTVFLVITPVYFLIRPPSLLPPSLLSPLLFEIRSRPTTEYNIGGRSRSMLNACRDIGKLGARDKPRIYKVFATNFPFRVFDCFSSRRWFVCFEKFSHYTRGKVYRKTWRRIHLRIRFSIISLRRLERWEKKDKIK